MIRGMHRAMHPVQKRIFSAMSPAEKWNLAVRLRQNAWALKAAWLQQEHPDWSAERVQDETRRIFLHART